MGASIYDQLNNVFSISMSDLPDCISAIGPASVYEGIRSGKIPTTKKEEYRIPKVKDVIYNGTTTIVKFADGSKTVSTAGEGEEFDRYTGFMSCVVKRIFGGTTPAKKVMNDNDRGFIAEKKRMKLEKEKQERIAKQKKHEEYLLKRDIERRAREMMIEEEARKLVEEKKNAST